MPLHSCTTIVPYAPPLPLVPYLHDDTAVDSTVPVQGHSIVRGTAADTRKIIPAAPDLIALLLDDKRSPDTRRAYESDLAAFLEYSSTSINEFVARSTPEIALALATYKAHMRAQSLSEATINRRLAAIRSLLKFAHRLGFCSTDGRGLVDGEKVTAYRDTRGVDVKTLKKLLAAPAKKYGNSLRTRRDEAILTLLIENALRRAEVCKLDESDFDASTSSLWILGKGRGLQKERVTLSKLCTGRVCTYVEEKYKVLSVQRDFDVSKKTPLFCNLDRRPEHAGNRITPDGLYGLVSDYGRFVGLSRLTPHQLRHSAITAALDATKGDVRRVQKLSRHKEISTLMIYDDNREDAQGQVTGVLSGLLQR